MNCFFKKVITLTIALFTFFGFSQAQDNCTLTGPDTDLLEATENSIAIEWEPIDGAVLYQLNLYLAESNELVQQIQTEATNFTFHDLTPNTFYYIGGQSGCSEQSFGPENVNGRQYRTKSGLVIIVDDLTMYKDCEHMVANDNVSYTSSNPNYDSIAPVNALPWVLYLNIEINSPSLPIHQDSFEIVIFENTDPLIPHNLLIGVMADYIGRVHVDQYNNIWMNNFVGSNTWHLIASVSDILTPTGYVQIGWLQDVIVDFTNCATISATINNNPQPSTKISIINEGKVEKNTSQSLAMYSRFRQNNFSFYPNPTSNKLTITLPTEGIIEIFDINGRVWHKSNIEHTVSEITVANWPAGTYIIHYNGKDAPIVQRFIKL